MTRLNILTTSLGHNNSTGHTHIHFTSSGDTAHSGAHLGQIMGYFCKYPTPSQSSVRHNLPSMEPESTAALSSIALQMITLVECHY